MSIQTEMKAHELCALMREQEELKVKIEELEAWFARQAEADLVDTKKRSVVYWGTGGDRVKVGSAGTVKTVSNVLLQEIFGRTAPDFLKEETVWKLSAPGKEYLKILYEGNYTEGSLEEAVREISGDGAVRGALMKKLKGKYEKDKETIKSAAGLSDAEASDWAYLIEELANYQKLKYLMGEAGWRDLSEVRAKVNAAIIVDESVKVTVEMR